MLTGVLFASVLALSDGSTQTEPAPQPTASPDAYRLEDLTVTGRRREELIRDFVENVAEPVPGRKLSRWNSPVCVGVFNLNRDLSQYLIDRISDVAAEMGVRVGEPGCEANVHIVATTQPREVASRFMNDRRQEIMPNISGATNRSARDHFVNSDAPIRWWYLSQVVLSGSGKPAFRRPGDDPTRDRIFVPMPPTRFITPYNDSLRQTYIIIDPARLTHLNSLQLADYLSLVALAQISPTADTEAYNSILNVLDDASAAPSLTQWDLAYLGGLYSASQTQANDHAAQQHIRNRIAQSADRLSDTNAD